MSLAFGKLRPLLNRIVVKKPDASKVSKGGIILKSQEVAAWGKVVAIGPGRMLENGELRPMMVKVGDDVLLPEYGGSSIKLGAEKEELFIYRDDDIMGVLEEKLAE
tara:strand:+ start:68 stop:385 length:318 start_codon:yes stop_codon:yes gene_type:complete